MPSGKEPRGRIKMGKKILILTGTLILIMTGNLRAEEKQNDKAKVVILEPITITAAKMERKLSEVSSNVTVISEKEIEASGARSVTDLLKDMEGIYTYDSSGVGTSGRVNMRGFWGGMSTHHLVLLDGIPQNKGKDKLVDWDLLPLDNVKRIEVVRGPASALYGDNAMSGVINIITKDPSDVPETTATVSYGNYNTQNYRVFTSGIVQKIGYYLGVIAKSTDGFRKYCDYEGIHVNGKLDFYFDETQALKLAANYREKENGAYPWALTEAQTHDDRRQARPGSENDKNETGKIDISVDYDKEITEIVEVVGTFYYRYGDNESFYTRSSTGASTREQLGEENAYGLPLRLNVTPEIFGKEHSFVTGVDLERNSFNYKEYNAPYQQRSTIRSDYGVTKDTTGPYVHGEIALMEALKIITGARYDMVEFDFTDHRNSSNSEKKKMSKITPKYGVVYTYQEDSNIYGSYAKAFRTPSMGQMFTYGSVSNPDLDPEEAENYEAGIRHRFNDYLKGNFSIYWMDLDNEIWYNSDVRIYENYGKTSHNGIETGLWLKLFKGFSSFANYTYTEAKNESGEYKNNYLTNIPVHKGSLGFDLETDFGLDLNLVLTRVGSVYLDSTNDDKIPAYTVADAKVSYKWDRWSIFLTVENLFDEKYNSYGYKTSSGVRYFNPAPGRVFTFGAEVKF